MNIKKQRPVLVIEQGGKKEKKEIKQVVEVKMDEKLEKVIELLEKEINGTITIKGRMPIVFEFQLPRIGSVNITADPILVEERGAEMIALGVKMELQNFMHFLVFKKEA